MKKITIYLTSLLFTIYGIAQPVITSNPLDTFMVNLPCGDSLIENFSILNTGSSALNISGGVIGGGGYADSSTITYTTTGALTTHTFNLTNNGIDTLFMWVNANGDYDQGAGVNEIITGVSVDGNSLGTAATQLLTVGQWDSTLFYMTGALLTNILADGQLVVGVQAGSGVNTGFANALDQHHVRLFTKGEGWLSGDVPAVTVTSGDSLVIPVTFYSFGLAAGIYYSTISINSNDPVNPTYNLPVKLNLVGTADYVMSDSCYNFGSQLNTSYTYDTLEITNTGCDDLYVTNTSFSGPHYSISYIDDTIGIGQTGLAVIEFHPTTTGSFNETLSITTNVQDTTICLSGISLPAPIVNVVPNPWNITLACGDSAVNTFAIHNAGGTNLILNGGIIGGGGLNDTSTLFYATTAATTTHNFNITNNGMDTLFLELTVNGDFDLTSEYADVYVDGVLIGTLNPTVNNADASMIFPIVDPDLTTFLANGQITVDIVNSAAVNTGFGTMMHRVVVYTNGEGWLSGTVPSNTIVPGDSVLVPVTFYSFGLVAGNYTSTITILSNDPGNPAYTVPVNLNLVGTADYVMSDSCYDFGTQLNTSYTNDTLELTNTGCDDLIITNTSFSGPHFNVTYLDDTIAVGNMGYMVIEFHPTATGSFNETLSITTNVQDTTICLAGISVPAPTVSVTPNPWNITLACGDSITEYFALHNIGGTDLIVSGGVIGGGGVADSSTVTYTTTGASTTHNFSINNTGIDTLWIMVAANGDYDQGIGANEYITDVSIDGISLGIAATQQLTIGMWDSTLFYMTDPDLSNVLADGMISVTVQAGSGVNTGFANALDQHHVRVYTNGEGWLSGTVSSNTIVSGDSVLIPVTFYSFGLSAGTYTSSISIQSNDPGNPTYTFDAILTLVGTANYILSDSCIDLGITTPGDTTMGSFTYTNTGCDDLYITSVTSTSGNFTIASYTDTVGIGQTGTVWVIFDPSNPGTLTGDIQIVTSVQDTIVCMTGVGTNITALFNVSGQDSCSGAFTFTDNSVGTATSWYWDFGDGNFSIAQNPTHAYDVVATYTVMFIACNSFGCDTTYQTVTPSFAPNYNIVITGTLNPGNQVSFELTGSNVISSQWDFGDGSGFPGTLVNHTYSDTGTYVVTVDVTTSAPCFFLLTETIVITSGTSAISGQLDNSVRIFPNPSNGIFYINVDNGSERYSVEILNALGQKIHTEQNVQLNNYPLMLNEGGIYLIRIIDDYGRSTERKIIINK